MIECGLTFTRSFCSVWRGRRSHVDCSWCEVEAVEKFRSVQVEVIVRMSKEQGAQFVFENFEQARKRVRRCISNLMSSQLCHCE